MSSVVGETHRGRALARKGGKKGVNFAATDVADHSRPTSLARDRFTQTGPRATSRSAQMGPDIRGKGNNGDLRYPVRGLRQWGGLNI